MALMQFGLVTTSAAASSSRLDLGANTLRKSQLCRLFPHCNWRLMVLQVAQSMPRLGDNIYALLGLCYANSRDYYNLNFDPNDAITYGAGASLLPKSNLTLFTVKDERLQMGQIITHAVWRLSPEDHQRWTVDLSNKTGRNSPVYDLVSGIALSVTDDYKEIFFRLAKDQKVSFTTEDQTRISIGTRL